MNEITKEDEEQDVRDTLNDIAWHEERIAWHRQMIEFEENIVRNLRELLAYLVKED